MDFNDPKEFDDPQTRDDQKGISIESMDFDDPKVYGDNSIFHGLGFFTKSYPLTLALIVQKPFFCIYLQIIRIIRMAQYYVKKTVG